MVFRLTGIASVALFGLVILRLTRLFLPTDGGMPWQLVALAAAALGAVITWVSLKARLGSVTLLVAHLLLFGLFGFLYVGGDISGSAVPPIGVTGDILTEVSDALSIFRYSSPPVTPLAGIVALASMMVWALSAVAVWGLLNNAPYLSIVPPVVFYLQLAVIDRQATGMLWTTVLLLLVGGGLAAIANDQRAGGGHAGHGRQAARIQAFAVPVIAVVAVTTVSIFATRQAVATDVVPATGILDWTNRSGIGGGVGSVSYNPFIDVRRSLVSNSETPVFAAEVSGDIDNEELYWRLLTMDTFNGTHWYASRGELEDLNETAWESDSYEFRGTTIPVTQDIVIARLAEDVLPAAYSPIEVFSEERIISKTTRVDPADGSLHIDGVTGRGMTYRVQSLVPDVDARALAANESGTGLSPLFDLAAQEGRFQPVPAPATPADEPRDLERYLQLPRNLDGAAGLRRLADDITYGLETDYEKALALELYFRTPGIRGGTAATDGFVYSTNIPPSERDSDLVTWLMDDTSPGYHTGYCEQFSASMGVLARLLDIPTRTVLGFTPGEARGETIVVKDRNAHAWVEVWLPAQGWVRFDPTPRGDGVNPTTFERTGLSSRDLDRYFSEIEAAARAAAGDPGSGTNPFPDRNQAFPDGFAGGSDPDATSGNGFSLPGWLPATGIWTVLAVLVLGTVPAIKRFRRRRRLRRLEDGDISAAWAVIVDRLIDSGVGLNRADTPVEVAEANDPALYPLASVYSESVYGPSKELGAESRQTASSSLTATEQRLRSRESHWQRLRRTYRVRSLLPDWIKRTKH
jgi:transglutaminase-like putative cysteine protease